MAFRLRVYILGIISQLNLKFDDNEFPLRFETELNSFTPDLKQNIQSFTPDLKQNI